MTQDTIKRLAKVAALASAASAAAFAAAEFNASKGFERDEPDYLLILGCTVHGDEPCKILTERINAAASYLKSHPNVVAVPCGGIVQSDQTKPEAEVIAERLISLGIDESRIIKETKSTTTVENFRFAVKLLPRGSKIGFLSSDFHLLRAGLIAKRAKITPCAAVPARTPKMQITASYLRETLVFFTAFIN